VLRAILGLHDHDKSIVLRFSLYMCNFVTWLSALHSYPIQSLLCFEQLENCCFPPKISRFLSNNYRRLCWLVNSRLPQNAALHRCIYSKVCPCQIISFLSKFYPNFIQKIYRLKYGYIQEQFAKTFFSLSKIWIKSK
jgi:hypothetical protein